MHMKRYGMPAAWPLGKKLNKFVATPMPGPHAKHGSVPMVILLRDVLDFANTSKEVKGILGRGDVLVDKKVIREMNHPVGLMDVVEFPSIKKQVRLVAARGGLSAIEIPAKEADRKLCMVKGKKLIKGGSYQISLHDGRTIVIGKEKKYKPGDSVLIELPGQKILGHYEMKPGVTATVIAGKNMGSSGKVKKVLERARMQEKGRAVLDTKEGDIETLCEYVLVGEIK